MNRFHRAILAFSTKLVLGALASLLAVAYTAYVVVRLTVAFFESNGMIKNPEIGEAFFFQAFSIESIFFYMLFLGLVGVFLVSALFANSQFNYFQRLRAKMEQFALSGVAPKCLDLGPFQIPLENFFAVLSARAHQAPPPEVEAKLKAALSIWPKHPRVSWRDQAQFVLAASILAAFFSVLSFIFFSKINDRIMELSDQLIRFKIASGPQFFSAQTDILELIMMVAFAGLICWFGHLGLQMGRSVSCAGYAVLRDLGQFLSGNYEHRIVLRHEDPAQILVDDLNESLGKMAQRLNSPTAYDPKKG